MFKIGDKVKVVGVMPKGIGSTMYHSASKLSEYKVKPNVVYTITENDGENYEYPYHINNTRYSWCSEELILAHIPNNVIGGKIR